jgi:hypothetical protein
VSEEWSLPSCRVYTRIHKSHVATPFLALTLLAYVYVCVCMCMCVYVCMCVCMCVYVCVCVCVCDRSMCRTCRMVCM